MESEQRRDMHLRISDADREVVVARLNAAVGEGRITLGEFSERTDAVYAARTHADLEKVTADLPSPSAGGRVVPSTASTPSAAPAPAPTRGRRRRVAVFSGFDLKGRWRVEQDNRVVCVFGGASIDLRQAELAAPEVTIRLVCVFGGADIKVPHGVNVDLDGVNLLGGSSLDRDDDPPPPGAPTVLVRATNVFGGVSVRQLDVDDD